MRIEDYIANRKTGQGTGGSLFGQTTQTPTAGLFGNVASQNKPAGGLFSSINFFIFKKQKIYFHCKV